MLKIGSCLKLSQAKSCPGMPLSTPTVHLGVEGGCTTMEPIASHSHSRSYGSPAFLELGIEAEISSAEPGPFGRGGEALCSYTSKLQDGLKQKRTAATRQGR